MASVEELAGGYSKTLRSLEAGPMDQLNSTYVRVKKRIEDDIKALLDTIESSGITTINDAIKLTQYQELVKQIDTALTAMGNAVEPTITDAQRKAIEEAQEFARESLIAQAGNADALDLAKQWTGLPTSAIESFVGNLRDGSPFRKWLDALGVKTAKAVTDELADGLARSLTAEQIAQNMANATDLGYRRAMTIARQSVYDSSRQAFQQLVDENEDIISGKQRLEVLDETTCAACWALHGKIYKNDEQVPRHVNCRGFEIAVLKGGNNPSFEPGEPQLRRAGKETQLNAFGRNRTAHTAWDTGGVPLIDFVKVVDNDDWGPSTQVLGLEGARKNGGR